MIRCITIDDEPLALKQMSAYVEKTPFLELVEAFDSALEALSYLQENNIDLMFVDINMPDLSGMEFVKALNNPPKVIFTTAYSEYAVEGFRVDAVDYLLKQIGYSDFLMAAEKANKRIQPLANENQVNSNSDFLFIKSEYKIVRIPLKDIKYIEGIREYVRIHLESDKPVMALMSMKKMEEFLPSDKFMRVHRSYIVNLGKITTIERQRIIFDKKVYIPISDKHKEDFQKFIDERFLI